MKNVIVLGAAAAAVLTSGVASAELTANAAAASNYVWRGVTQTNDQAAVSGGIDYAHGSGFYAGTWASNVAFGTTTGGGYELDLYAGFGGEAGGFGYDLGVISYQYPVAPSTNFTELYVSGSFSVVSVGIAYTVDTASANEVAKSAFDKGDMYANASIDFETDAGDISLYAGSYMFDNDGKVGGGTTGELDYIHYGVSISKDGFTLAFDKNDVDSNNAFFALDGNGADDNFRITVSYALDFELM